jgi:hypothetical protein
MMQPAEPPPMMRKSQVSVMSGVVFLVVAWLQV